MKIIQTKNQKKMSDMPTRLEWLRELNKRHALNKELKEELIRLELGFKGEQDVLELVKEFGDPNWSLIQNLWLRLFGHFENDIVLLTNHGLQTIEIKNYSGSYEYLHSQFLLNGVAIGHNPISQAQRSLINVKKILKDHSFNVPVEGNLVFTGNNCDIKISQTVAELNILMMHQVGRHIQGIRQQEKYSNRIPLNPTKLLEVFDNFETISPFQPEPLTDEMKRTMLKGIVCSHCGSKSIKISRKEVSCRCSTHEPRENAIVRTICEYGVMNFDKNLVLNDLVEFFSGQVSRTNIRKYLLKHFDKVTQNKNTRFLNKKIPFIRLIDTLLLANKCIRRLSDYR